MVVSEGGTRIRRLVAALCALCVLLVAAPTPSSAAVVLALPHSDYPHGSHLAVVPATNANADHYLHPAHRSSFHQLHRIDGAGWLQFGTWTFRTGIASGRTKHTVAFGYGINVFRTSSLAQRALRDVKLKTTASTVSKIPSRRYLSRGANATLLFVFLAYRNVEVEAYYEYTGTASTALSKRLRRTFLHQEHHLVTLAKRLTRTPHPTATSVPTVTATDTATPTETATATPTVPAATVTATDTPTVVPVPSATPAPTLEPVMLAVYAAPQQPQYAPGDQAVIVVHVTNNGVPVVGASVGATATFYQRSASCTAVTNANGDALCMITVPTVEVEGTVHVVVNASYTRGAPATTSTSFEVKAH